MSGHLQPNTVQTVRGFLASLNIHPSTFATSQEVIDALIDSVQLRRDDPCTRRAFTALVEALAADSFATPERMAHVDCELRDPEALARHLTRLLDGRPQADVGGRPRLSAVVLAAATLLLGATVATGCEGYNPGDPRCRSDLTLSNFHAMVWSSDLRPGAVGGVESEYLAMAETDKREIIEDLCSMDADEIASYILDNFTGVDADDIVGDDFTDDDASYKGVNF